MHRQLVRPYWVAVVRYFKDSGSADFFHIQQQYKPDLDLHASYQRYYTLYASLYNKLKDDFKTLNNILG